MIKASQFARSSRLNEFFRQFHSFTGSDEVVVPYVQDSDKCVEELTKTFQGLSSPSTEDRSVDLAVPRR